VITKQHIDEYIRLNNNNQSIGGHASPPKIFADRSNYNKIDELFSRMILEKNVKVSGEIADKTKEIIAAIFDSKDTFDYFKNYVGCYKPDVKYITKKPWWKFW
jgi:hypothetical protein